MRTFQLDSSIQATIEGLKQDSRQVIPMHIIFQFRSSLFGDSYPAADVFLQVGVILGRNSVGQRDLVFSLLEASSDKVRFYRASMSI